MEKELMEMIAGVIERNTTAMEKSARASDKMAEEVRGLRATIQGAQRKIGGELGKTIERSKAAAATLEKEAADAIALNRGKGGRS